MSLEDAFEMWAPAATLWSAWAKPVLFSSVSPRTFGASILPAGPDLRAIPEADRSLMVILDLPGMESVAGAVELARRGYRPVPLFNALPGPDISDWQNRVSVCNIWTIVEALVAGAEELRKIQVPAGAPPVFMLDADRATGTMLTVQPGMFDNRSVSLPTDFPSGSLLMSHGLRRVILVQRNARTPQPDLAHTLLRYQEMGMEIEGLALGDEVGCVGIKVARPARYRRLWQRFLATIKLRRGRLGGFGGYLPLPSGGSGG